MIGINNRDLTDFTVDLERTFELLADIPAGKTVVSESGIARASSSTSSSGSASTPCWSGESLMRAADVEAACRDAHRRPDERRPMFLADA